jgi:hypothetical protein
VRRLAAKRKLAAAQRQQEPRGEEEKRPKIKPRPRSGCHYCYAERGLPIPDDAPTRYCWRHLANREAHHNLWRTDMLMRVSRGEHVSWYVREELGLL